MEWQDNLFDEHEIGAYRWDDPDTSKEAAESVDATAMEAIVFDGIRDQGSKGATNAELCAYLDLPWNTVSPRCAPLARKGYIYDSGERRLGPSGRNQIVWKVVPGGPRKEGDEQTHPVPARGIVEV